MSGAAPAHPRRALVEPPLPPNMLGSVIPLAERPFLRVVGDGIRGERVVWFFDPQDPDGRFQTRDLIAAWHDDAWHLANPEHPFAYTIRLPDRPPPPRGAEPGTGGGAGRARVGDAGKKAPPCDEPGFLAAQVFALAAETGWPEERILHMPLARLAQYQHCLLRRNGVRTDWSSSAAGIPALRERMEFIRARWRESTNLPSTLRRSPESA